MMANDPNKNDWFKAGLVSPSNTLGDFKLEGLNSDNIQLLSKDDYKEKDYVKQAFANDKGGIDEKKFNEFYDQQQQTFNMFVKDEYDDNILNGLYFSDLNYFESKTSARKKLHGIKRERVHNPQQVTKGFTMDNVSANSKFTVRELAQRNKILDPKTGKYEDFTPNDLGFLGTTFNTDTYVMSQWEEDGTHFDSFLGKNVEHKAGEYRLNDDGDYQYEKLGKRSVYGKQVLNPINVITKDGSFANKFDFMDSDSMEKSFTGTILKTATEVAPYLIPKVKNAWLPVTLTKALVTDILPVLSKSVGGILFGESVQNSAYMQSMDKLQGIGARFSGDNRSDSGTMTTFNRENILGMAGDVFSQIAQQRYLAKIPMWLGSTRAEAKLLADARKNEENLSKINDSLKLLKSAKTSNDRFSVLREAFANQPGLAETLNKWQRWSSTTGKALGMSYMSAVSSTGMHEEAKAAGLNDRDAGIMTVGLMAAMGGLMASDIGSWTLKNIGLDDIALFGKQATKEQSKRIMEKLLQLKNSGNVGKKIGEEVSEAVAKKAWYTNLFNSGKNIGESVVNTLKSTMKSENPIIRGAIGEAVEEMSEEALADTFKLTYNALKELGYTSTKRPDGFEFSLSDAFARYAMSALGGAIGGGISGLELQIGGKLYSTLPDNVTTDLSNIVINGLAPQFRKQLEKDFKEGKLPGNPKLTPSPKNVQFNLTNDAGEIIYEPTSENGGMSQNEAIFKVLMAELDFIEKTIYQEGDINNLELKPIYQMRESKLLDLQQNSPISDDIHKHLKSILSLEAQITSIEGGIKNATQSETDADKMKIAGLRARAKEARNELDEILSGRRASEYVGHAIFHLNTGLSKAYNVKDLNGYAESIYNKPYKALTEEEAKEVEEAYEEYVEYEKREASKIGYQRFKRDMEIVKSRSEDLRKWANQRRILIEEGVDSYELPTTGDELSPEMGKISSVFAKLAQYNADLDMAVQSPVGLSMTQTDIPQGLENSENVFESYINLLSNDKYVNPELVSFLRKNLDANVPVNYRNSEGQFLKDTDDIIDDLIENAIANDSNFEFPPTFFNGLKSELKTYLNSNFKNLTYNNINSIFESLENYGFTNDDLNTWMDNRLKGLIDPDDETSEISITELDEDYQKRAKDFFKREYDQLVKNLKEAFYSGVEHVNNEIQKANDVDASKQELINSAVKLSELIKDKEVSPFHEMLNEMASVDGVVGMESFFDTIARQYSDSYKNPENFIINSGLDVAKLKYGINTIERLKSLLTASTVWEEQDLHVNKLIGYTNAINNISIKGEQDTNAEPLPEFNTLDFETLFKDLYLIKERVDLILNLSDFNINGTVRESKVLGARALTLYIDSVSQDSENFKLLKDAGLDTTDLEIALNGAVQYATNMMSIESDPNDPIPLNTSDDSFARLKLEADKIEQEIYKIFNKEGEDVGDRVLRLRDLIKSIDVSEVDASETGSFTQNTTSLPKIQQLMYLFQSASIDPKQFYNDMAGDVQADVNDLVNSKLIPFLNQELVIKQLYFYTMSKYKTGIDVYSELMDHLLPVTDAKQEDRHSINGNREDLLTLRNAIFLDGVPGAGKTSTAANFLNKMIARYDLTVATYAPFKEQSDNLNNTLEHTDNLINSEKGTLNDLFNDVFGVELHDALKRDTSPLNKTATNATVTTNTEIIRKRLEEDSTAKGFEVDRLNKDNPEISKFLQELERLTINGKVPNVIIIDEATHIPLFKLELLNAAINVHNSKNEEKISLVLMGDTEQNGATISVKNDDDSDVYEDKSNLVFSNMYSTPKLSQAFRSFYSTLNENATIMRNFRSEALTKGDAGEPVSNKLTLKYKIDSKEGLIGAKTSEFAKEDLEAIFEFSDFQDKVAVITNKIDSDAVQALKAMGIDENRYEIIAPNNVQGLERTYVIIDLATTPSYDITAQNLLKFDTEMNTIYTSLTRSKKGALINSDASGGIDMNSTSQGVDPYKVELNVGNLNAYRQLTLDVIKNSHAELEDLPQNFSLTANNTVTVSSPSVNDQELAEAVLTTGVNNIQSAENEKGEKLTNLVNTQGEAVVDSATLQNVMGEASSGMNNSTDGDLVSGLSLSYMFHEKLGALINPVTKMIDSADDIENHETNDADLILLAKTLGFYDGGTDVGSLNDNLEFLTVELKKIRTSILTYMTSPNSSKLPLPIHLFRSGVDQNIISKIKDLNFWKPKIMIRPYTAFDDAKSLKTNNAIVNGGSIAYVVLADPTNPNKHFTISAMPNVNNPNLPNDIRNSLNELYAVKSKLHGSDIAYYDYDDKLILASNLVLRTLPRGETTNYDTFVSENSHLNISEPLILSGDLFNDQEAKELDAYLQGMSVPLTSTTDNKHRLRGLPFILVSTNKDNNTDTRALLSRFKSQVKEAIKSDKFIPGDIRMVMLRPKTRTFSSWFNWNSELGLRFNKGESGLDKDLAASENNYVAAKIMARFTTMLAEYNKAKRETSIGNVMNYRTFLPDSIAKGAHADQSANAINARIDAFMSKIQATMDIAIPAMLKMRYVDYVTKLTSYGIGQISDTDVAISELFKRKDSELKDLQKQFYPENDLFATLKAKEHYVTKQLLSFINGKLSNTDVKIVDKDEANVPLNKEEKGALVNMVVALRTALNGGTFKLDDQTSNYQPSIFGNNLAERESFIKELDAILTSSEQGAYQALFPGGINSNVVYRRRNDSNKFTGALPFAMETGIENSELEMNVDVQLPKLFINLASINLNGTQKGGTSPVPQAPVTTTGNSNKSIIQSIEKKISDAFELHLNRHSGVLKEMLHTKYPSAFDTSDIKTVLRDVTLNAEETTNEIISGKDYSDATVDAFIREAIEKHDNDLVSGLNSMLKKNIAILKTGESVTPGSNLSDMLIPGEVRFDKGMLTLKWQSADKVVDRYINNFKITEELINTSSDFKDLISKGYVGKIKTDDGVNFFYVLENSDNSEIFGKFVLQTEIDSFSGYPSIANTQFELLRANSSSLDLTNLNDLKKHVNNMLANDKELLNKFDNFVSALSLAVQNDFANINSEDAVKQLSSAYLDACLALRQDPAALQALRDQYRDFVNAKKC